VLRVPAGRDPHPRRPRRARRPLLDGGRPCAPHRAVAHVDPDEPHPPRPRSARQRQLRPPPDGADRGRGLPAGRVPDGRLRLGLSAEARLRARPRLRHLRRLAPAREGRPPHRLRREDGGPDDGRRPPLARRAAPGPRPVLPLGALLRPARSLRGAGRVHGAGGDPVRRRDLVRGRPARPPAAARRGERAGPGRRPRHRRPRREPGRARRGHPRHLRLRLDTPGPLHPRRGRRALGPRGGDGRERDRRRADAPRLRGAPGEGDGGPVAPPGGLRRDDAGRAGLRGVAPPAAPVRLGSAPRLADGPVQAHRGAPSRALRPPGRPGGGERPLAGGAGAARGDARRAPKGDGHHDAGSGAGGRRGDGRSPGRPRLRRHGRRQRAFRPRPQGRDRPRHAPRPQRHDRGPDRAPEGNSRAHRDSRRGPRRPRGPPHAGDRLRGGGAVRERHPRPAGPREEGRPHLRGRGRARRQPAARRTAERGDGGPRAHGAREHEVHRCLALPGCRLRAGAQGRRGGGGLREDRRHRPRPHGGPARAGRPRARQGRPRRRREALRARSRAGPDGRRRPLQAGRREGADRPPRRGDRRLPQGRRGPAEERRQPPVPRRSPRLDRAPRRGRPLLRAGPRRGPAHDDGAERPRPDASRAGGPAGGGGGVSRVAAPRPEAARRRGGAPYAGPAVRGPAAAHGGGLSSRRRPRSRTAPGPRPSVRPRRPSRGR
jgi:hypothetical protein